MGVEMGVRVVTSQALTEYSTGRELGEVEGSTVQECLDELTRKLPELKRMLFNDSGSLHEYVDIFINRETAFPDPLSRPVKNGDELFIICLIGGG